MDENKKSDAQAISHPFPTPRTYEGKLYYGAADVAKIIGLEKRTVTYWHERGLFTADARAHDGRYLYEVERVMQLKAVYHPNWTRGSYEPAPFDDMKKNVTQQIENLPDEILALPRFFPVKKDKVPKLKGWSKPENQKLFSNFPKGYSLGFDTCGHGKTTDYLLLDFDHVLDDNGNWVNQDAEKIFNWIISNLKTYCELSQSKHGVHIIAIPTEGKFKMYSGGKRGTVYFVKGNTDIKLEIFYKSKARYCLFTGNLYYCEPNTPIAHGGAVDAVFQALLDKIAAHPKKPLKSAQKTQETPKQLRIDSTDYDDFRAGIMLDTITPDDLADTDWFAVISSAKNIGISYPVVDTWCARDPDRYNAEENLRRWNSATDPSFNIETLHGIAKRFGYSEKETRSRWYQLHPELFKGTTPMNDANSVADMEDLRLTGEQCAFLFSGNLSDRDNGDRIAYLFGDSFKFVTNHNEWITFSSGVWKKSAETNSAIYPFARELQKRLIANAQDAEERKFAKPFDSAKKLDAAIRLLRGNLDIRITSQDLDTHKNLLNCLNGVIDLETGKLMEAAPELLLTQQANAVYRPDYHDPTVEKFLRDIMPREDNLAALTRWLGYALTGENSEQCALFTVGDGSNGKSTLFELMLNMLGDYATNLPVKAVVESRDSDANATTTQLNVLAGARFALVDEFKPYHRLDVQQFKSLTGDRFLKIRRLHKEYETIELLAKLFLNGNELPRLDNTHSYALRRRIRALSFTQIFSEERGNLDKDLSKKLATPEALSGMLTICVEAAQLWYRNGLLESSAMKDTKADYLNENDFIEEFISERCGFSKGASIRKKDFEERLKQEYPAETLPSRIRPRDLTKIITAKMENHGVTYQRDKTGFTFKGVGWLGTPKQQSFTDDFGSEPVDPNETPF